MISNWYRHIILLTVIVLSLKGIVHAQENITVPAEEAVRILKSGGLIVILPSYHKKLSWIDTLLNSTKVSDRNKKNLQKRKEETIEKKKKDLRYFASTIARYYRKAPLAFAYDTVLPLDDRKSYRGIFIDTQGNPVSGPSFDDPVLIARPAISPEQGLDVYIFTDVQGHRVAPPFPKYVLRHYVFDSFKGLLKGKQSEEMAARRFVKALQRAMKN